MDDFFAFLVIAFIIYGFFSRKNKAPERRQRSAERPQAPKMTKPEAPKPVQKKKEGFFESLEKQVREAAERFEKELQGQKAQEAPKEVQRRPAAGPNRPVQRKPQSKEVYKGEGYSDYGRYPSTQGTQNTEGSAGVEGRADREGTWGSEGRGYAQEKGAAFEKTAPPAKPPLTKQEIKPILRISSSELVQAVIWAEVLKEPKSKRILRRR